MAEGLYRRVTEIAREKGISHLRLRELMFNNGLTYLPAYMDSFATPDDVRVIARLLQVPPSRLLEVTTYIDPLLEALVEEKWSQHANKTSLSMQEAVNKVKGSEFRWNSPQSPIRNQVDTVLKALESPAAKQSACLYPDCEDCVTRCKITGYMIGVEG